MYILSITFREEMPVLEGVLSQFYTLINIKVHSLFASVKNWLRVETRLKQNSFKISGK